MRGGTVILLARQIELRFSNGVIRKSGDGISNDRLGFKGKKGAPVAMFPFLFVSADGAVTFTTPLRPCSLYFAEISLIMATMSATSTRPSPFTSLPPPPTPSENSSVATSLFSQPAFVA